MGRMDDGFSTLISLGGTDFWEKSVTPPGLSAGGEIDTTTMRNTTWRTRNPKSLVTMTPMSATCAYDPEGYETILAQLGVNQEIVVTFPDGSTLTFWGWLDEFTPGESVEGEQPTADVTFIPSNQNASGVETAPVYAAASS